MKSRREWWYGSLERREFHEEGNCQCTECIKEVKRRTLKLLSVGNWVTGDREVTEEWMVKKKKLN